MHWGKLRINQKIATRFWGSHFEFKNRLSFINLRGNLNTCNPTGYRQTDPLIHYSTT